MEDMGAVTPPFSALPPPGSGIPSGGSTLAPDGVPEELLCPISHEVMQDPVLAADGHAYERAHIEEWLARQHTSPLTGEPLPSTQLLPCHALRKMAAAFHAQSQ